MMSLQEWHVCWLGVVEWTGRPVALELVANPNPNGETRFLLAVTCYVSDTCQRGKELNPKPSDFTPLRCKPTGRPFCAESNGNSNGDAPWRSTWCV
jgi:hypothetical protein